MSKSLRVVIGLAFGGGIGIGVFVVVWTFVMLTQWPLGCMPDHIASALNCMAETCPESCQPEQDKYFYLLFFGTLGLGLIATALATYWFVRKAKLPSSPEPVL